MNEDGCQPRGAHLTPWINASIRATAGMFSMQHDLLPGGSPRTPPRLRR
jgi:hypothetical protein